jgi:hypothetical protein
MGVQFFTLGVDSESTPRHHSDTRGREALHQMQLSSRRPEQGLHELPSRVSPGAERSKVRRFLPLPRRTRARDYNH